MTSEFQTVQLEEVADLKGGYAFKSQDYTDFGRFVLRTLNIDDSGRITRDSAAYISEEKAKEYERFELEPWDTLFVMVGATLGKVGLIKESDLPALLNQNMWVVRAKKERVNPRYLHYAFGLTSKSLLGWASGAARDFVRRDDFRKMHLHLPARPQQDQIAHILGTLDDKIELNRRINETLEAIARAIFKSWFVDFDPVRAKASGEPPESICRRLGFTPDLLALFPDRLVDSELGEIPDGWNVCSIADHCYLNAVSWTAKTLPAEVHYVDLANAKNGVISEVQVLSSSAAPSRARRVLRAGDTIIGTVRPGNRSFALIGDGSPQLTGSTGFAVLSPKRLELRELVYFLSTSDENIDRLSRLADGAAYPAVRPEVVSAGICVAPAPGVIDAFHGAIAAMIDCQMAQQISSSTLAATRDALLPKLLSGELRVPVAGAA